MMAYYCTQCLLVWFWGKNALLECKRLFCVKVHLCYYCKLYAFGQITNQIIQILIRCQTTAIVTPNLVLTPALGHTLPPTPAQLVSSITAITKIKQND